VVEKKVKKDLNTHLVALPHLNVNQKVKAKHGVKNLKNNISINILLWKILI